MRTVIIIQKATIFAIETWVCLCMTLISASFLLFDVATQGFRFSGSLIPLVLTLSFVGLSVRAERKTQAFQPKPLQRR
jgi:hypothetical protein